MSVRSGWTKHARQRLRWWSWKSRWRRHRRRPRRRGPPWRPCRGSRRDWRGNTTACARRWTSWRRNLRDMRARTGRRGLAMGVLRTRLARTSESLVVVFFVLLGSPGCRVRSLPLTSRVRLAPRALRSARCCNSLSSTQPASSRCEFSAPASFIATASMRTAPPSQASRTPRAPRLWCAPLPLRVTPPHS